MADNGLTRAERAEILAAIARDESCYPRDRINAIRVLVETGLLSTEEEPDELYRDELAPRRSGRRPSR